MTVHAEMLSRWAPHFVANHLLGDEWRAPDPKRLRVRLYLTREEGPPWLRMLALCAWLRGGVIDPAALEGA